MHDAWDAECSVARAPNDDSPFMLGEPYAHGLSTGYRQNLIQALDGRLAGQLISRKRRASLEDVIAARGGSPLLEGGKLIGAIGCSGGTGSQDEVACKAGAATVK